MKGATKYLLVVTVPNQQPEFILEQTRDSSENMFEWFVELVSDRKGRVYLYRLSFHNGRIYPKILRRNNDSRISDDTGI